MMERAWALIGRVAWAALVAVGIALVWKWAWDAVSGGSSEAATPPWSDDPWLDWPDGARWSWTEAGPG
jgi:hypothetical protein